jgi:hypothetical protein
MIPSKVWQKISHDMQCLVDEDLPLTVANPDSRVRHKVGFVLHPIFNAIVICLERLDD